jgi:hypothetical protein
MAIPSVLALASTGLLVTLCLVLVLAMVVIWAWACELAASARLYYRLSDYFCYYSVMTADGVLHAWPWVLIKALTHCFRKPHYQPGPLEFAACGVCVRIAVSMMRFRFSVLDLPPLFLAVACLKAVGMGRHMPSGLSCRVLCALVTLALTENAVLCLLAFAFPSFPPQEQAEQAEQAQGQVPGDDQAALVPAPGEHAEYVFDFGKYKKKTLAQVMRDYPGYCPWLLKSLVHQNRPNLHDALARQGLVEARTPSSSAVVP